METPRYEDVRNAFARLRLEDKARFLIEATAATLADGIETAGALLARGLECCMEACQRKTATGSAGGAATES
ncbi:hypothetical protein Rhom172_1085 [Rhodothermus marinus SG0.5JP17-172]|uniref:hypothetical protein n=1 Tax=Rhodothermus marinus TaxID=29549 RepID=UPI000223DA77|nr:hypothetical protein [Rhodothermus marinus]AEN73014.1 hypothetical protein Rhom172_1085 [Rhodothermus marinus SG0.5JP17-172]MBO2492251.1 hypothetical protein [Rhodothermus marinus]